MYWKYFVSPVLSALPRPHSPSFVDHSCYLESAFIFRKCILFAIFAFHKIMFVFAEFSHYNNIFVYLLGASELKITE